LIYIKRACPYPEYEQQKAPSP